MPGSSCATRSKRCSRLRADSALCAPFTPSAQHRRIPNAHPTRFSATPRPRSSPRACDHVHPGISSSGSICPSRRRHGSERLRSSSRRLTRRWPSPASRSSPPATRRAPAATQARRRITRATRRGTMARAGRTRSSVRSAASSFHRGRCRPRSRRRAPSSTAASERPRASASSLTMGSGLPAWIASIATG